jgi:K+-transporting ATPase c subunit
MVSHVFCSLVCKSWRDLIQKRLEWTDFTIYLREENQNSKLQVSHEHFLRSFGRHWTGLHSLTIEDAVHRQNPRLARSPAFSAKQVAQLLPQARQLKSLKFVGDTKVSKLELVLTR